MAFEARPALSEFGAGKEKLRIGAFTDDDWRKILALAREHGFDRAGEYEDMLFPEQEGFFASCLREGVAAVSLTPCA